MVNSPTAPAPIDSAAVHPAPASAPATPQHVPADGWQGAHDRGDHTYCTETRQR